MTEDKYKAALLALAKAKIPVTDLSRSIAQALSKSLKAGKKKGQIWEGDKNPWLTQAYLRKLNENDEMVFVNHDGDTEAYLAGLCEHALQAHRLIQQRKAANRALSAAKRRISKLSSDLLLAHEAAAKESQS